MDFQKHYFTEEQIDEFSIGKDSYFTNILRKAVGSAKRKINPRALDTTELSPAGYTDLFNLLTNKYTTGKKTKYHIKDLFQGVFSPKDAKGVFGDIEITDKNQIEVVSYFKTSNGGAIALYNIKDDDDEDKYFIGIDDKGQKYFAAKPKQGGIGMLFKAWASAQKANQTGTLGKSMTPTAKKKPNLKKIEIDKERYLKIAPEPKKVMALAASTSYDNFLNNLYLDEDEDIGTALDKAMNKYKDDAKSGEKPEKPSEEEKDAFGELFYEIKKELKDVNPVKPTENVKYGWRYLTNNGGVIFVYEGKDTKYYISFDKKGELIVKKYNLVDKYDLEIADAPE